MGAGPLDGVRVIEAASYVSGPFAGQMLADLGAEVIKVETPPAGDAFRHFGRPSSSVSPIFANCNRGKRSVSPNLKDDDQRARLLRLVSSSDVWMSNWRPGVAERLGLGDEQLVAANPGLIRAYITGYGSEGPAAGNPVFDLIVQAASGATHASSPVDQPQMLPGFPVDKITSMMTVQAVVAALFSRERTGAAERVDISMLSAAAYVDFVELFANRTFLQGQPEDPRNLHAVSLRPLPTADGWVALAPVSGRAIRATCEVVGHPEWVEELRSIADQTQMAGALFDRLETVLPSQPADHWLARLAKHDVPAALCMTMDAHIDDPQVRRQGIYRIVDWEGFGPVRVVRYPAEFESAGRVGSEQPPPEVGRDNPDLLA
jgi:crotonobetainyl-CoA:carnitine CoA-transferase CaiB-like acyl-CoA transferase